MLGNIRSYPEGESIISEDEIGTEMYVIIKGKVEISTGELEDKLSIAILGPGDNFGEMAIMRHGWRSANGTALEETEVLIMDNKSLERIQRRYPRIAAAVFRNLTIILSDRLQITTVTAMLRGK